MSYQVRFEGAALLQLNGLPSAAFDALIERVADLAGEPWDATVMPPGDDPAYRMTVFGSGHGLLGFHTDPGYSQHHHSPPRAVLLADRFFDICPWSSGGRLRGRTFRAWHTGINPRLPWNHSRRPGWLEVAELNTAFAFWFSYTITRPLGASFGDFLAVPAPYGDGLQIGTGPISLASGTVLLGIIALIDFKYRRTKKVQGQEETVAVTSES